MGKGNPICEANKTETMHMRKRLPKGLFGQPLFIPIASRK